MESKKWMFMQIKIGKTLDWSRKMEIYMQMALGISIQAIADEYAKPLELTAQLVTITSYKPIEAALSPRAD